MSKGVLVYARNNEYIDYTKQAYHLALRVKQFLDLPVSIISDSIPYIKKAGYDKFATRPMVDINKELFRNGINSMPIMATLRQIRVALKPMNPKQPTYGR